MLAFCFFLFSLVLSGICHLVARRRPFAPALWVASVTASLFRESKLFIAGLTGAMLLHLAGTIILGPIKYNLNGFDIVTHTMFGFFTRELIERIDKARPFIGKIRSKAPRRLQKYITASTLAFAVCACNAIQEELSKLLGFSLWSTVWTNLADQLKDVVTDTIGIIISLKKEGLRHALKRA